MKFAEREFRFTRFLFVRCVAAIYLVAFVSAASQMLGLYGEGGILPIKTVVDSSAQGAPPSLLFFNYPSVFWFDTSDSFIKLVPTVGIIASLLALLGVCSGPSLFVSWILYLSIVTVGQEFMSFQWDILLCETGFLSLFFATWRPFDFGFALFEKIKLPAWSVDRANPSVIVIWLLRWLLFRLMWQSGICKIASNDPTWSTLTAMKYHYETQPLPTPLGWFMHQLPLPIHSVETVFVFFFELVLPFLIFLGRKARLVAAAGFALLQLMIILTGNYCFFNWLTIALCLVLLDDGLILRTAGSRLREFVEKVPKLAFHKVRSRLHLIVVAPMAVLIIFLSTVRQTFNSIGDSALPAPAYILVSLFAPWHLVSSYGLFASMTTSRPEISMEGSDDGEEWKEYVFKYKPGPTNRPPPMVAPMQPRLDWQMWFAALGSVMQNQWLVSFAECLLKGNPSVLSLMEQNPFPAAPPKYIRAIVYDYQFTDIKTLMRTGKWWRREYKGIYLPPVTSRSDQPR